MQGLILAAGMGRRLKDLTQNNTKCMVRVNGVTLIERMLKQLDKLQLNKIVIVVGYEGQKLKDYISTLDVKTEIVYVENEIYDKTNNIYSLALAKNFLLEDDTLLLESDLIFEDSVLECLINDKRETLALVDRYEAWMDGTCIKIGSDDSIEAFVPGKRFVFEDIPKYYKTVNIYKFSKHFSQTHYIPFLDAYSKALGNNEYYEQVLRVITMLDEPEIKAKCLDGQKWYEIDDVQDLDIASSIFSEDDYDRLEKMQSRYGGYWRYPKMIDFCYLVNPFYPPKRLVNEMMASFEVLLTQYPSGMRVNSLLAAKNFGVAQESIAVGNGAAELIKCLLENTTGKLGLIRPTFEEYPNRYKKEDCVVYIPDNDDFSYSADDVIQYFEDKEIANLLLINPDNPSGNYIPKADVLRLADWCEGQNITFILDESFVDFAEENDSSLISNDILNKYKNLIIVKSISKSYGVPGIRLGVVVSSDSKLISLIKKQVSIWNINSYGEFYMQIEEKYKKDYDLSLVMLKNARRELIESLSEIPSIRVIPSQANYVMFELTNGMLAKDLTLQLLTNHNILVKDLTGKIRNNKQYIRIAVRNADDNSKLIEALKMELN